PVNATIQAAQTYVLNVRAAEEFLVQQDAATSGARYAALLAKLKEARDLLRWNPASGRPAHFLAAKSGQARVMASRALALAAAHGVPELRELVVRPYVLLYAHGANRVVLLALKHERQLVFKMR
ncbi:MAG: hypothetical protein AB7I50_24185, partial [Vicinamibacterales bacterium]